jgi:hypothetical protein
MAECKEVHAMVSWPLRAGQGCEVDISALHCTETKSWIFGKFHKADDG